MTSSAEDTLRAALEAAAVNVQPAPHDYGRLSAAWRRRERRQRLVLAAVATLVFAAADGVGLWALSHANPHVHVIFSDTPPARGAPPAIGRIGQP